jgi:hypothetical protein
MTEFYTVKKIDNSRLTRLASPDHLRDCFRRLGWGVLLAACGLFYACQHFQSIQLRYQIEGLHAESTRAAQLNQELQTELAGLVLPARIDRVARERLGLTIETPGQMTPAETSSDAVLAQAHTGAQPNRP